jgi:hypothetical protein
MSMVEQVRGVSCMLVAMAAAAARPCAMAWASRHSGHRIAAAAQIQEKIGQLENGNDVVLG